jgi:hypothetical protein
MTYKIDKWKFARIGRIRTERIVGQKKNKYGNLLSMKRERKNEESFLLVDTSYIFSSMDIEFR